jgi:hypothetical protein
MCASLLCRVSWGRHTKERVLPHAESTRGITKNTQVDTGRCAVYVYHRIVRTQNNRAQLPAGSASHCAFQYVTANCTYITTFKQVACNKITTAHMRGAERGKCVHMYVQLLCFKRAPQHKQASHPKQSILSCPTSRAAAVHTSSELNISACIRRLHAERCACPAHITSAASQATA